MIREKTLAKLDVSGGDDLYILTTTIGEDGEEGFDLIVSDGKNGWTGSLDENDLETLSHDVKMDYSEYVKQTRKALSRLSLGTLNFVYQSKRQKDGSLVLSWKKHMMAENIKIQLGSIKLTKADDPSSVTADIFNQAIVEAGGLQSTINTLQAENERMATERTNALKRLEKCISAKEELETDLYAKFAIVVNDKKAKIRELKSEVEDLRNGISSSASAGPSTSNNHSGTKGRGDRNDSDEDIGVASDYDTDEEAAPAKKKSKPAKKVKNEPVSQDDSLMLDTGDDVLPSTGRRRRREATKKTTPSKAVLPKVNSTPKTVTPSTSRANRRTSMRKSGSNTSNISSDQVDADDMIDDMF